MHKAGARIAVVAALALAVVVRPGAVEARAFNNVGEFTQACSKMIQTGNTADLTLAQLAEFGQLRGYVDATVDSIEALYPDICLPAISLAQVCAAVTNWYSVNPAAGQSPAYTGLIYALKHFYPCPPPTPALP